jgi:protein TonB
MPNHRSKPTPTFRTGILALIGILVVVLSAAALAATGERPIKVEGDVAKPITLHKVQPEYPEQARKDRVTGTVILQTIIDTKGLVTAIELVQSVREDIDKAAIEAIRQWRFDPATLKGEPVEVYYNLTINFRLDKDKPK